MYGQAVIASVPKLNIYQILMRLTQVKPTEHDPTQARPIIIYFFFKCSFSHFFKQQSYDGCQISSKQNTFLSKIQNCISEKTRRKIVLLSCKNSVKEQFLGVVEFPSIFLISKILSKHNFRQQQNFLPFQKFKEVVFPSYF